MRSGEPGNNSQVMWGVGHRAGGGGEGRREGGGGRREQAQVPRRQLVRERLLYGNHLSCDCRA